MRRKRGFYILIITLTLGGIFQAFKGIEFKSELNRPNSISGKELSQFDLKPFHLNNSKTQKDQKKVVIRKLKRSKKTSYDFAKQHTFGKKLKKKVAKKKKTKKKKTKKKKKVVKADKKVAPDAEAEFYEEEPEKKKADDSNNNEANVAGGRINPAANDAINGIPQTVEEWLQILLVYPSHKKLVQFIDYYQSRLLPTTVFYDVLTAMAEDRNENINTFAVKAASSTPSENSFYFLMAVIEEPTLTSKVKNSAKSELGVYKNLQYLKILKSIVRNSEFIYAQTFAATLIAQSAKQNLVKSDNKDTKKQDVNNPENNTPDRTTAAAASSQTRISFEQTKEVLTNMLNLTDDNELSAALTEAISVIEDSLSALS